MKSALNVLAVVEELATNGPGGVSDLARRTDIAKSTVQRCLDTLVSAGWITAVGPAAEPVTAWRLSDHFERVVAAATSLDLVAVARPVMDELARASGEAVHLVGLDGGDVVLLERLAGSSPIQVVLPVGFTVPAHAAATGKAILAELDDAEVDRRIGRDPHRLTDATIVDVERLRHELAEVRRTGWATNVGEWEPTVAAVASAIVVDGAPVAAISVSSTPQRLTRDRVPQLGAEVRRAAGRVARLLATRRLRPGGEDA